MTSIYEFPSVKFVKEFDVSTLYDKVKEIMGMRYTSSLFDDKVEEFIRLHSSWDSVANVIREIIESNIDFKN